MRTLVITTIFVVLNGLGFAYRAVSRRGAAPANAAAAVTPGTPAVVPDRAPAAPEPSRAAAITPAPPAAAIAPAVPAVPSAAEPNAAVPSAATNSSRAESEHDAEPVRPGRSGGRTKSRRQTSTARGAPDRAQPALAPDESAASPAAAKTERTDPSEGPARVDDSLLKMEANPYKRGE